MIEEISKFTGKNYDLRLCRDSENGIYVSNGDGVRYFKNEFRAIEWCEGYIEAVERYDYCIDIPLNMAYIHSYLRDEASERGMTMEQIIIRAINKYCKHTL